MGAELSFQLYDHQKVIVDLLEDNSGFAIFAEQGTGKTLPILVHLNKLLEQGNIEHALIVAPKATMGAWDRDMELFDNGAKHRLQTCVTVINYDRVWRGEKYNLAWDCIVLDESHFIKNRSSKRASFLLHLSLHAKYRYILTGTPIGNGALEDIWAQLAFIDPIALPRGYVGSRIFGSWKQFVDRHCVLNRYWKPYRYLHIDEIQDAINDHSYSITKAECLDLPDKLPDEIYDIELQEKKLYKEIATDSASLELDILCENPLAKMLRLRQICSGFITNNRKQHISLKCEKTKALNEFLDGYDKKLVIFAHFTESIRQIESLLTKRKLKFVTLDGRQKDKKIWRKFQEDETIKVIVCQYQSASQGIDLFASDTILFYEPPIQSNLLLQARDRIHRIGQKNTCSYIFFITKGTVERAIYTALSGFADFSEKLFNEYINQYTKGRY